WPSTSTPRRSPCAWAICASCADSLVRRLRLFRETNWEVILMTGRPTLPPDVEYRLDLQGAALPLPGLTDALDEERALSMADEGGRSAAYLECQPPLPLSPPWARQARSWLAIGIVSLTLGLGVFGLFALRRRSPQPRSDQQRPRPRRQSWVR